VSFAAVLGAGSWGTTFAKVLADAGRPVVLWSRRPELVRAVRERRENPDHLPGVRLPERVTATTDPAAALAGARLVALAVPAQSLRGALAALAPLLPADALLVSLMKGVEIGTARRMSEVVAEVGRVEPGRIAVVSGPNLAAEIAAEQPAATVVAGTDGAAVRRLQQACTTPYLRPYTNSDVVGCEIAGAAKNVIALACGMAQGKGFGDNTRASLVTRGLAEIRRLGIALGGRAETFAGLAGLGDLVVTCSSPLSRNRRFGEQLGRGRSVGQARAAVRETAEGVASGRPILDLATRCGVDMPITEHVVQVVEGALTPDQMVKSLMSRDLKAE
jgi:glycerol-3-phosphate dehydrogenase (NAD(P)+)